MWIIGEDGLGLVARECDEFCVGDVFHRAVGDAALPCAEKFSRTTQLQINFRQCKSVGVFDEGMQARTAQVEGKQEAVGLVLSASDASAELVQLGESKTFGVFNNHDGRIGDIHANFYHGCGYKNVNAICGKVVH